jgi:hypothetical protein
MSGNPYAGQSLDNQTQGSFAQSLGTFGDLAQGGALARTDLSPYMNPYIQNVVGTTMGEMNHQQAQQAEGLASQAQAQNAFGGDRFAIQQAANDRDWNTQKGVTLSNLFNTGFNTATANAQQDIQTQAGAASALGGLANQGFNWGNSLADQANKAAGQQQGSMQGLLDAIKGQYQGFTQQGTNPGLTALQGIFQALGSNMSSSQATSSGSSSGKGFGLGG